MQHADRHLNPGELDRYLDQDLVGDECVRAEAHLDACSACRREISVYSAFLGQLDSMPLPEVPAGFDVRILDAVLPRPSESEAVLRLAGRAYAAIAVVLAAVAATLLGTFGSSPVTGSLAPGITRVVSDSVDGFDTFVTGSINLFKAMGELLPLASALQATAHGIETAVFAMAPSMAVPLLMTLVLAALVLVWASTPARERGVPHVSLL